MACFACSVAASIALIEVPSGSCGDALALAVGALDLDPGGLVVLLVEQHHVGDVDRALPLDDPADLAALRRILDRTRPLVALDHVESLDEDVALLGVGPDHAAALAAVLAADHDHVVVLADSHRLAHRYRTSGARETIRMKFRSRSSRATGPKMRVPRGTPVVSIRTAAFSSKAM